MICLWAGVEHTSSFDSDMNRALLVRHVMRIITITAFSLLLSWTNSSLSLRPVSLDFSSLIPLLLLTLCSFPSITFPLARFLDVSDPFRPWSVYNTQNGSQSSHLDGWSQLPNETQNGFFRSLWLHDLGLHSLCHNRCRSCSHPD